MKLETGVKFCKRLDVTLDVIFLVAVYPVNIIQQRLKDWSCVQKYASGQILTSDKYYITEKHLAIQHIILSLLIILGKIIKTKSPENKFFFSEKIEAGEMN